MNDQPEVQITERDGRYYATCEQMPGFLLISEDLGSLKTDIAPAMRLMVAIKESKSPTKRASDQTIRHSDSGDHPLHQRQE